MERDVQRVAPTRTNRQFICRTFGKAYPRRVSVRAGPARTTSPVSSRARWTIPPLGGLPRFKPGGDFVQLVMQRSALGALLFAW